MLKICACLNLCWHDLSVLTVNVCGYIKDKRNQTWNEPQHEKKPFQQIDNESWDQLSRTYILILSVNDKKTSEF